MKFAFHTEQLLLLAFKHPFHRDSGPFGHYFSNIFRSDRLRNDRILDGCLPCGQFVDLLFRLGHPAVTDLGHLAVIPGSFGVLCLDLVILYLLSGCLEP